MGRYQIPPHAFRLYWIYIPIKNNENRLNYYTIRYINNLGFEHLRNEHFELSF